MVIEPMSNKTLVYTSTLLIPERTVWLPYVGLVVTVAVWLGYDFYRFHWKNIQKYARVEEHMTILRAAPSRQRISMVSGIGLRFKRGKPILGDVWNTSPSSSDASSCCDTRRRRIMSYSREVTPSDEGGEYSDTDLFACSNTGSYAELVGNEVHNIHQRSWEIGGEYVKGNLERSRVTSPDKDQNNDLFMFDPDTNDVKGHEYGFPRSKTASSRGIIAPAVSIEDKHHPTGITADCVGGGVDDGGGGILTRSHKDVATQTHFSEFIVNVISEQADPGLNSGHTCRCSGQVPYLAPPPRMLRNSEGPEAVSSLINTGESHESFRPGFKDFYSSRPLSVDSPGNSVSSKYSTGKPEKRHPPPLQLDLMSGPYSPTTEIVATKHGFAVEGLEVPHFPGSSGRSRSSNGSDVFKPASTLSKGHSLIKPLSPSPAVARVSSPRSMSPHHTSNHRSFSHRSQRHRHRRQDSLTVNTSVHPSSVPASPSKRTSHSLSTSKHHPSTASSYPRMVKDYDTSGETVSLKMFKDSSDDPPKSAPIPSHLFHQDEEGFFSSINSSASQNKRMFNREADDYANKGILFFSRLAGIGRNQDQGMTGGGGRYNSSSYKTGGFES